ncbi:hypothetical protein [Streptomyces sp. NPDC048277]|uniref:hypothetical protein n=1 Tax=Streptomyces sp. NPDC048277 TaxID=3155027 RepID=UPI0033C371C9
MSGIEVGGRQLHLEGWADVQGRHRHWCEGNGLRPLWTTLHLDPVESDYLNAYARLERSRAGRAAVGSALIRRITLFLTGYTPRADRLTGLPGGV